MLKVSVEGIYESDIGSGQKKYENFNYDFKITKDTEEGIETHVLRRFIPYLIAKDKTKKGIFCSRIKDFHITNTEKIDEKSKLLDKDIKELDEWEIQDLACLFDLYEVPAYGKFSITELRNRAILAYLKKVLKVPMKTPEEKAQLDFYKKMADGTYKADLTNIPCPVVIPNGYFEAKQEAKKEKKSLDYFFKQAGQAVANAVLSATGNETITNPQGNSQSGNQGNGQQGFPSLGELGL